MPYNYDEFTPNELAYVLGGHGALTRKDDEEDPPGMRGTTRGASAAIGVNSLRMQFGGGGDRGPRSGGYDDFDDDN